ncbi:MAG: hypothetical protein OEZ23_04800 [Gammaproteobacteria bacterium]|nr:hypothetical protein [Gammaproteobacteria bacterium]
MGNILFIGDEISAAAYRLAGIQTLSIAPPDTVSALNDPQAKHSALILLSAAHANAIRQADLHEHIRQADPPLMIVSDVGDTCKKPDFLSLIKRRLGVLK